MPSSRYPLESPRRATRGFGIKTPVPPEYADKSGKAAKDGSKSFTLHGISRTSSANPRKSMKQMVANAAL